MMQIVKIITRCLVVEFYKQNAAFFGLIFLVFFGFIKAGEHIAIGSFLVANPSTLFFLYVLWIAYGTKVILFLIPAINKKENQFLESFYLLSPKIKFTVIGLASILLLIPAVLYSFFLVLLAIPTAFFWSIASVVMFLFLLLSVIGYILLRNIQKLPHEKSFIQIKFLTRITKPHPLFFIEYLIRNDFVLLLLSKAYTCLIIIGTSLLYTTDQFDIRLLSTGVLLGFAGNAAILHKFIWFSFHKMQFIQNLPISLVKNIAQQCLIFLILILPEVLVLIRYFPVSPTFLDVVGIFAFGLSITTIVYGFLLIKQMELSNIMAYIFWLIVVTTFLILFSIHPIVLAILYFLVSCSIIYLRMYKFEYVEKNS